MKLSNIAKKIIHESKTIETNKGTFQVRYATDKDGVKVLVMGKNTKDGKYADAFDGEYGDEIPYTKEGLKKYDVKIPSGFRV